MRFLKSMSCRRSICVWLASLLVCSLSLGGTQALWLCLHEQAMAHVVHKDIAQQECHAPSSAEAPQGEAGLGAKGSVAPLADDCTDIKLTEDNTPTSTGQQLSAPQPVFVVLFSIVLPQVQSAGDALCVPVTDRALPAQLHAALSVADSVVFRL